MLSMEPRGSKVSQKRSGKEEGGGGTGWREGGVRRKEKGGREEGGREKRQWLRGCQKHGGKVWDLGLLLQICAISITLSLSLSLRLRTGAETSDTNQQKRARELRHLKESHRHRKWWIASALSLRWVMGRVLGCWMVQWFGVVWWRVGCWVGCCVGSGGMVG